MLPILSLIPSALKQQIADNLVEFLAKQAEKVASEQVAGKVRKLSSQAAFRKALEQALEKGALRFQAEYMARDEDLTLLLASKPDFWQTPSIQHALLDMVRRPGAWLEDEQAKIVRHFEDVLPERVNRQRVDNAVSYYLRCIVEELWTLPGAKEIREVYALQFQRLTAEAAREQTEFARQQLQATTQLSADMRKTLAQLTSAMEQHLLNAPSIQPALPPPLPYHNLPRPDYSRFVGRQRELEWLRQRLLPDDRAWLIAITGIGGAGKSSLALAIAHEYRQRYEELPPNERFQALIWVSAKEEVLTIQGRERAALPGQVLHSLEDVYTTIAQALDREDITRALPEEQGRLVQKILKDQRTLLIMDNLESVKDERIKPFLRNLPLPSKAILTSREWVDVADVLSLSGMTEEEAELLVEEESSVRGVSLSKAQRQRIYDLTARLPLPIKLAVARLASGESLRGVERWLGDADGDLAEYCIAGQAELAKRRDANTAEILQACALFERNAGVAREALGQVSELSLHDRDAAINHLQQLFLLNRTSHDRFWMLPVVERFAQAQMAETGLHEDRIRRWIDWLLQFARREGEHLAWKAEQLPSFQVEYPNILRAIRWCHEQGRWEDGYNLAEATWRFAYEKGLFHEMEELIDIAQEAAQQLQDEVKAGRAELQRYRLDWARDINNNILERLEHLETLAKRSGNTDDLGTIWSLRSSILARQGQIVEAEAVAHQLLAYGEEHNDQLFKMMGAYRLSAIATYQGQYDLAEDWLQQAEQLAETSGATQHLNAIHFRRGMNFFRQGKLDEAEKYLLQALQSNIHWGEERYIAHDKYRLANIYARTGRPQLAKQFAQEAYDLFTHLGMPRDAERSLRIMVELLNHGAEPDEDLQLDALA